MFLDFLHLILIMIALTFFNVMVVHCVVAGRKGYLRRLKTFAKKEGKSTRDVLRHRMYILIIISAIPIVGSCIAILSSYNYLINGGGHARST